MVGCRARTARCFWFLITLLVLWAAQGICAKKKPPLHPINLNTASSAELQQVPGIGPATAEKILQARKSYGGFKSVDDLQAIRGIGPKKLDKMRKYLTITRPATPASKPPSQAAQASQHKESPSPAMKSRPVKPATPSKPAPASEDEEQ